MWKEPRFGRLRAAFDEVQDLAPPERDPAVRRWSGGDPAFEAELRSLLAEADRSTTPLDRPPLRELWGAPEPPESIPGYRLLQPIGRGGSAIVYRAEQRGDGFSRPVALKVLTRWVDAALLRRFRGEQRILASLEHPGIARLYDAGITPAGRPYLAMELVRGSTLIEHCADRQAPRRLRIELFVRVLEAVEHAHASAIVHRDLKPGNILVSERGEPKLLDFGIARLLDGEADAPETGQPPDTTETRHRALTPAYASPEQLRNEAVDRRSDIYSLGVVLYELLTGRRPYKVPSGGLESLERAICEQEPVPAGLGHDLEAILDKALRKEPAERYASAADFAADLLRHLDGRPVLARRPSLLYRWGKGLKRRRGLWLNAALAAALAAGLALWLVRPGRPGDPVDPNLSPWLAMPVSQAAEGSYAAGLDRLARLEPTAAIADLRTAAARDSGQPLIHAALATAHSRAGHEALARAEGEKALALADGAPRESRLLIEAVALRTSGRREEEGKLRRALWLLRPGNFEIGCLFATNLVEAGAQEEALEVVSKLRALPSKDKPPAADLRIGLIELEALNLLGRPQEVLEAGKKLVPAALRRNLPALAGRILLELSLAEDSIGQAAGTREMAGQARSLFLRVNEPAGAARSTTFLCIALFRESRHAEAERVCSDSFRLHRQVGSLSGAARALGILGASRQRRGLLAEARATYARALEIEHRSRLGDQVSRFNYLHNLANLDSELGRLPEAEEGFRQTIVVLRETGNEIDLMRSLGALSTVLMKRGSLAEAETLLGEAETLGRRVGSPLELGNLQWLLGDLANLRGDSVQAIAWYDRAASQFAKVQEGDLLTRFAVSRKQLEEPSARICRELEAAERRLAQLGDRTASELSVALSRCWSDSGSPRDAQRWLALAARSAAASELPETRIDFALAEAAVALGQRRWAEAERVLSAAAEECRRGSLGKLLMDTRLFQTRLALARGDHPERVRTLAEELERDAKAGQFGKIARDAGEILSALRRARG